VAQAVEPEGRHTRTAVLRVVALSGPLSRTAIAADLQVSAATVTAVTRELIADGLIEPAGKEPNGARGRPAELLRIVPGVASLLGVKVAEASLTGVVADLLGTRRGSSSHPSTPPWPTRSPPSETRSRLRSPPPAGD
jgi:predicted ArsR family transcriptional regulator